MFYTLKEHDVGKCTIHAFGKAWAVVNFIGRIYPDDVGKRVYEVNGILQVENDAQRKSRLEGVS
jgi:hypothetical protein